MTKTDIAILKLLYNGGDELRLPPAVIADNIGYSPARVRQRVKPLRETDCISYYDESRGVYEIANRGRSYILGEMSEAEADALDDDLTDYSG